ncbi:MAG: HAMP domain-containing protein [Verrucomicrobia bacterium]|nr:HAMP domain-containing protein [Verrucomicrobiota bacterium]
MNTRSVSFQLSAWYAGLLTAGVILFGTILWFGIKHHLESNVRETQLKRAVVIAETLVARIGQMGEADVVHGIRDIYAPELNNRFVRITRPEGGVLYVSGVPSELTFNPASVPKIARPVKVRFSRVERFDDGEELLIATVPVPETGGGSWLVEVGASLSPVRAVLRGCLFTMLLAFPVMLLVAIGGGLFLARRAFAPVEKIIRSAEELTLHNLSGRLAVTQTGDELERLSTALNHMIARLDEAFQHNRRFLADASHELRTPMTILRGELEAMLQQADGAPELQERIGSVLEEVERLAKIVEGLFALSRLDAGEAQTERVRFDLAKLAATTAEQMSLLAEDKGVAVNCAAAQPVEVEGDRARLKQVIVNLLDNAIKFTPKGGNIMLSVSSTGSHAVLEVADTGIGIPAEAMPRVFERFFRVDKARSRGMGGAGLGLSIVKSIVAAHGGTVSVKGERPNGTSFQIQLPNQSQLLEKENKPARSK